MDTRIVECPGIGTNDLVFEIEKRQLIATNVELLKFSGRGGFDDIQTTLEMRGGVLELSFERADFGTKINTVSRLVYDRRFPEKGLVVSTKTFMLK